MRNYCPAGFVFLFVVLTIARQPLYAQGQASKWYFGIHAGLDFSSGVPVVLINGQTNNNSTNIEGCATICDSAGQLLFYTDGETVYNRTHAVMPNGTAIGGGQSSSQSAVILPKPGDPSRYYIFTTDDFIHNLQNGLNYTIIDMCLDGGLGDAVPGFKNVHVMDTASEKLAVCRHSNGTDYWVISQKHFTNIFYAYQVSASGIINTVTSAVGPVHGDGTPASSFGEMKVSPDHSKIALVDGQGMQPYAEILDFNNSSGVISNPDTFLTVTYPGPTVWYYGVSFSPNSRFVYFATSGANPRIVQYDLLTQSITYEIYALPGTMGLQLAPDGKIYCVDLASPGTLSVINFPDSAGPACNFAQHAINLNVGTVSYGLPEFLDDFVYPQTVVNCALPVSAFAASDATICPGSCIDFINLSLNANSYQWIFSGASPATSTVANPQNICYTTPGSYFVTLIATSPNGTDLQTLSNYITVYPAPPPQSITQNGDTLFASTGAAQYQWYFNGNQVSGATDYYYVATANGDYNVVATDANGCEVEAAVFNVIAGVHETSDNGQPVLFPNPVTGILTVQKLQTTDETSPRISIYNVLGENVLTVCCDQWSLDCRSLAAGMYRIEISADEKNYRNIFIKQ